MERRYFTVEQISEYLGISTATVYRWTQLRQIPFLKMGRVLRFDIVAIEKWVKEFRREVMD